jgi:hypothetical protein
VYLDPTKGVGEETREFVRQVLAEKGANARGLQNALIFTLPEATGVLLGRLPVACLEDACR